MWLRTAYIGYILLDVRLIPGHRIVLPKIRAFSISAFSLACGVIQIVIFSTKALTMPKGIYKHGVLSEYDNLKSPY